MDDRLWRFIDSSGEWWGKAYGIPPMTGRVFAWLLVCEPAEQTAAQLGEALEASMGSISGATRILVRAGLVDRLHVRGERADRFRVRAEAVDEQLGRGVVEERALLAQGLEALEGEPPVRRARLEQMDEFYAWWQSRLPSLSQEWQEYRRGGKRRG